MKRVTGIGGVFLRARDPVALAGWYREHLGLDIESWNGAVLRASGGDSTIWSVFPANTKYFEPSQASFMMNYIIDDLDALLDRLAKDGVRIDPKRQDESYGRFAWIYDPDGNKIELWQPLNPGE